MSTRRNWICSLEDIIPESGVCALLDGLQIALFRVSDTVYAIDNHDPASATNVLARGLVGELRGEPVVASPLYKHHYSLRTGQCLEDPALRVAVYPAQLEDGQVWVSTPIAAPAAPASRRRKLVVVGNGMAGMRTVEQLLQLAPAAYDITVVGAEPYGNYNRILLSSLLAGEKHVEDIILHPLDWYVRNGVMLHAGDSVVRVDRYRRVVHTSKGVQLSYDRLLLATGSQPVKLQLPGCDLHGVVTFRDLADVEVMLQSARAGTNAVVIGGGLLGLEAANGLLQRGMNVTVAHLSDVLMERQLDSTAARFLKSTLEQRGIKFRMPANTAAILGERHCSAVCFADGTSLPAELVVMAAGVRPNIELAIQAGLRCERGILVNDTLQTFDPAIYAVGECVQHRNRTFGLIAPLWEQARVCAAHLAELGTASYHGTIPSTQLKVSGIELFSAGDFLGDGAEAVVLRDRARGVYKRLVIRNNRLCGAVLYGDAKDGAWYVDLMAAGRDIASMRETLLFGPSSAAEPAP